MIVCQRQVGANMTDIAIQTQWETDTDVTSIGSQVRRQAHKESNNSSMGELSPDVVGMLKSQCL